MFETLMYLVGVHALVSEVTPPLLDRTLNALVESLVEEALRCFKQVKRFGMGGMLRVGLSPFFSPFSIRDLRPWDTDRNFIFLTCVACGGGLLI
jgi:Exocyst complex component Sec5